MSDAVQSINGVPHIPIPPDGLQEVFRNAAKMVDRDPEAAFDAAQTIAQATTDSTDTVAGIANYVVESIGVEMTPKERKRAHDRAIKGARKGRRATDWRGYTPRPDKLVLEAEINAEAHKAFVRAEGRARYEERRDGDRPMLADSVLEWGELIAQPEARWIVDGVIPERATVIVYGASGVGKSFVCQSIAASLAGGFDWLGRPAEHGSVLYIFAEGGSGAGKRFQALADAWNDGKPIDGLRVLPVAPNLTVDGDVAELEVLNQVHDFAAIVYDTLNRVAGDAEENSATAMSGILNAIERVRRAGTRTTSIIVHHAGKSGDQRGSTALWAAADTVLELTGEPTYLRLDARKQKDAESGLVGFYRLTPASTQKTLILEGVAAGQGEPAGVVASRVEDALATFVRAFGETGATRAQFVDALVESGLARKSTVQNYVGDLISSGRLNATRSGTRGTFLTLPPTLTTFPQDQY